MNEEKHLNLNEHYKMLDLLKNQIIVKFPYGSTVYGTITDKSDVHMVCIVSDTVDLSKYPNNIYQIKVKSTDYKFINEKTFIELIKKHDPMALESLWLPNEMYDGNFIYRDYFKLDTWQLRKTISSICNNSWAKAHKKLTVEKDYNLYIAQKSLYHCIRLYMFGSQIAIYGKIIDYHAANFYWNQIYNFKEKPTWENYKNYLKTTYNSFRSEFIALCPKTEKYIKTHIEEKEKKDLQKLHKTIMDEIIKFCRKHKKFDIDKVELNASKIKESINFEEWTKNTPSNLIFFNTNKDTLLENNNLLCNIKCLNNGK